MTLLENTQKHCHFSRTENSLPHIPAPPHLTEHRPEQLVPLVHRRSSLTFRQQVNKCLFLKLLHESHKKESRE